VCGLPNYQLNIELKYLRGNVKMLDQNRKSYCRYAAAADGGYDDGDGGYDDGNGYDDGGGGDDDDFATGGGGYDDDGDGGGDDDDDDDTDDGGYDGVDGKCTWL
jgi:hypothetical protein